MNSPIRWYGGKGHLTKHLLKHVPPHTTYVEPFGGGASLLFAKQPSKVEVYNDIDSLLVNFFRVLRDQPGDFVKNIRLVPYSRGEHLGSKKVLEIDNHLIDTHPARAAVCFYVLCRQSMSGDINGGWSYGVTTNCVNSWLSAIQKLPEVVHRFRQVQVEHGDALEVIKRYDTPETFFYLDPPYYWTARRKVKHRTTGKYRYELGEEEHKSLLQQLCAVKGMVLLSGYHCMLYDQILGETTQYNRITNRPLPHQMGALKPTDKAIIERWSWHHEDIKVVAQAAGTTRPSGLTGEGALKEKQKRVEVLWWNQNLETAIKGEEMPLFVGSPTIEEGNNA